MSAITTAVVVGSIAAAGTVTAAKIQSNAAKNAAKSQADAAQKSLDFQRDQYGQERQDFNPYQTASAQALQRLGSRASAPTAGFQPPGMGGPPAPTTTWGAPPQLGQMGAPPPQGAPRPMGAPQGMPQQGAGPLVRMRGPDGSERDVPTALVPQLQQKGATVITHG